MGLDRILAIGGVAAFATLVAPVYGVPIPAGTTVSDDLLINFNLTSQSTSFDRVTLGYNLSSPDASGGNMGGGGIGGDVPVTVDVFGGLNGDTLIGTFSVTIDATGVSEHTILTDAGVRDGLFSIGLRVAQNVTATAGGVFAVGRYFIPGGGGDMQGGQTVTTNEIPGMFVTQDVPNPAPEPATLALLGVGIAGLRFARRRARSIH